MLSLSAIVTSSIFTFVTVIYAAFVALAFVFRTDRLKRLDFIHRSLFLGHFSLIFYLNVSRRLVTKKLPADPKITSSLGFPGYIVE